MSLGKDDFFIDCVGAVTILTVDRIVFQGKIRKDDCDRHHETPPEINIYVENEFEFLSLELRCKPALISDKANRDREEDRREHDNIEVIKPTLFEEGDIIRINLAQIVAIGPSNCCFCEDEKENGDD